MPDQEQDRGKKTLVLDLDETLVHSSFKPIANPDYIIPVEIEGRIVDVYVLKRPWLDQFMAAIAGRFEVRFLQNTCPLLFPCPAHVSGQRHMCPMHGQPAHKPSSLPCRSFHPLPCQHPFARSAPCLPHHLSTVCGTEVVITIASPPACWAGEAHCTDQVRAHARGRCMIVQVVVFTASLAKYADPLLDLMDKAAVVRWRLFREACCPYEGNYVKVGGTPPLCMVGLCRQFG